MPDAGRDAAVLEFWFGPAPGERRKNWFAKDPGFDREIRDAFLEDYRRARSGALDGWREAPESCLALVLLLDQFPRNMFRGAPEAFAGDAQALAAARHAVVRSFDAGMAPERRLFLYLPFEHSEHLEDQRESLRLMEIVRGRPGLEGVFEYAECHLRVIERFGRFPHRNAILGRPSTPEELEFLAQPCSSF
ncbi:MAG TPA: DUF924 family protein [Burkholderiales bacterium]|nr:DUF924 family protein [Burkholderiales bacterium]